MKTSLAANNVDVNSGSAKDVESATASKGDLNQETIANNAELEAYGYQSAATSDQAQAGLDKATAAEAPIGADIGAMGSLLSSASGLSSKWTGAAAMPVNLNGSGYTVNPDGSGFAVGQ